MHVSVRAHKAQLSVLLKRVDTGEEIVVTSQGRRDEQLGPVDMCASRAGA